MDERELLELAAEAAGIILWWHSSGRPMQTLDHWTASPEDAGAEKDLEWNPLIDDGDAFRLAVALELGVASKRLSDPYEKNVSVVTNPYCVNQIRITEKHYGGNERSATRRAIVRAAAEIGKQLKTGDRQQ